MSELVWSDINNFARKSGYKLVFDLNVLIRKNGHWDSSNAENLINYSDANNYEIVWQLGNEPNSFRHVFGTSINPLQLAQDFKTLRRILHHFPYYNNSFIIGPDVTKPKNLGVDALTYLRKFLFSVNNSIDAVTWHQYYLHGGTATFHDFISPVTLNLLQEEIAAIHEIVKESSSSKPIWLSETSSASGGGAPGLSDTFVAGFLWLDKLGIAALAGISVVIRQSLYGGHYSLLDKQSLEPLPDWWLSILYKKLVGRTVLSIEPFIDLKGALRVYAHCSSNIERSLKGSIVTLFGMNLNNETSFIQIIESLSTPTKKAYISAYVLTGTDGPLSKTVNLNGKKLQLLQDGALPELKPTTQELSLIILPPLSLGFWTIHGINMVSSCP